MKVIGTGILFDFFRDDANHTAATQNASGGITGQSTQPGEADARQSSAPEPTQTRHDAPDGPTCTAMTQDAPCGITAQSTLPGKADAGAFPAGESSPAAKSRFEPFEPDVEGSIANLLRQASGKASSRASGTSPSTPAHACQPASPTRTDTSGASRRAQTHAEPAVDTLPSDAPQNAPKGTTMQSTQPDKAASQPDDAARLQARIDGCLAMETDPALRMFLEQLRRDSHKYPVESVRQELEAYLQPGTPGDFLNRLAALHMSWALDDVASDPDGKRLVRGDTGGRKAILERIEAAFRAETEPVARCYLAKLARKAVSNPPGAGEGLEGYIDARTSPTWLWLAAVFVAGNPEAAFQWRLQEARRSTASAWLLGYLDKLEQEARESLPMAVSKLEAFIEILALLDNPTHTTPAQNAPETITDGAQPCAVA
ncbi:hypothetical protein J8C01_01850 [Chloracidobacterium sp. D]|uniref:hypothetical protein n=1 Tax=Chloracidobacterium sp. D TaxID=2821536 RepID=UPI001B8BC41F|nr:hypothetical protein [Chloracidobacterium sp. D]QUV82096.1 hypothetical protein J8C01_01850 [Chloracidobacterium sp. D]